jgi:hypothetical protein
MLSGPLFAIIVSGTSITFGLDCSWVLYTLFYVYATEGIIVGLSAREDALSSGTGRLFISLIYFYVGGGDFFLRVSNGPRPQVSPLGLPWSRRAGCRKAPGPRRPLQYRRIGRRLDMREGLWGALPDWCGVVRRHVVGARHLDPMGLGLPGRWGSPPPPLQLQVLCVFSPHV